MVSTSLVRSMEVWGAFGEALDDVEHRQVENGPQNTQIHVLALNFRSDGRIETRFAPFDLSRRDLSIHKHWSALWWWNIYENHEKPFSRNRLSETFWKLAAHTLPIATNSLRIQNQHKISIRIGYLRVLFESWRWTRIEHLCARFVSTWDWRGFGFDIKTERRAQSEGAIMFAVQNYPRTLTITFPGQWSGKFFLYRHFYTHFDVKTANKAILAVLYALDGQLWINLC